jgi:hypothetical protein
VGLAVQVLFTPDSGAGTRDHFRRKSGGGRDLVKAKADEGRDSLDVLNFSPEDLFLAFELRIRRKGNRSNLSTSSRSIRTRSS